MQWKDSMKRSVIFLTNTKRELARVQKQSLEEVLEQYLRLLILSGVLAAISNFLWIVLRASYYRIVSHITIDYQNLLNYSLSISAGTFFFYLFIGTFGTALITLVLRPYLQRSYLFIVKITCVSLIPPLLFGWISVSLIPGLLLWSIYIFILALYKT